MAYVVHPGPFVCLGQEAGQGEKELVKISVLFVFVYKQFCFRLTLDAFNLIFAFYVLVIEKHEVCRQD